MKECLNSNSEVINKHGNFSAYSKMNPVMRLFLSGDTVRGEMMGEMEEDSFVLLAVRHKGSL